MAFRISTKPLYFWLVYIYSSLICMGQISWFCEYEPVFLYNWRRRGKTSNQSIWLVKQASVCFEYTDTFILFSSNYAYLSLVYWFNCSYMSWVHWFKARDYIYVFLLLCGYAYFMVFILVAVLLALSAGRIQHLPIMACGLVMLNMANLC